MTVFQTLMVTASLGLMLAVIRFAMLAFLPDHPLSRAMGRLDRQRGR